MLIPMSESDLASLKREIAAQLDQLDRLHEEAAAAIDAIPDHDEAFKRATEFADQARDAHTRIASRFHKLRVGRAVSIKERDSLSIGQLATRISVSKARADQLLRKASKEATL
jgi:hypothetical protein